MAKIDCFEALPAYCFQLLFFLRFIHIFLYYFFLVTHSGCSSRFSRLFFQVIEQIETVFMNENSDSSPNGNCFVVWVSEWTHSH